MVLVSAVITTHKREPEIVERALKSVIDQTHTQMEIIVVDDSPSNYDLRGKVREMVEKYSDRNVKYIQHEECKGACAARNTGLFEANGDFVAFLDDDDEWKPEKIEKQLQKFTSDCVALVYSGSEVINDSTQVTSYSPLKCESGNVYDKLIVENFIGSTSFPLLRKSALLDIDGFDVLMQSAQDYDVWLRISQKYNVECVNESLVIYHVHNGERISSNYTKKINGLERLNEKNKGYLSLHKEARRIRTMKLCPMYAKNGQLFKAVRIWIKAALIQPWMVKENLTYLYDALASYVNTKHKGGK